MKKFQFDLNFRSSQSLFSPQLKLATEKVPKKGFFYNRLIDKSEMKKLISWVFQTYGSKVCVQLLEEIKQLGFSYATLAGLSLGIDDLRIPTKKDFLIFQAEYDLTKTLKNYKNGQITSVEYFQKLIDTWNQTNENLKLALIENFVKADPLNPLYMMAFSGARGNISQVRQLAGMRGLMANPQGEILDLPIKRNFREGLTVTEYIISCYGARKGLVDTALRTADSGYLTRRLVDIAQGIVVREKDCQTQKCLSLKSNCQSSVLVGRVFAKSLFLSKRIAIRNEEISPSISLVLNKLSPVQSVSIRSPLTCQSSYFICQLCYGWSLAKGKLVDLGEAVGILAAQSIGEPGTQLTMRTFHTGGVFTAKKTEKIFSPGTGWIDYSNFKGSPFRTRHGEKAFYVQKKGLLSIRNKKNQNETDETVICSLEIQSKSLLFISNKSFVIKNQIIGEISESTPKEKMTKTVVSEQSGEVELLTPVQFEYLSNKNQISSKLWVLNGSVLEISKDFLFPYKKGDKIESPCSIAEKPFSVPYSGWCQNVQNFGPPLWKLNEFETVFNTVFLQKCETETGFNISLENSQKFSSLYKLDIEFHSLLKRNQLLAHLNIFSSDFENVQSGVFANWNFKLLNEKSNNLKVLNGEKFLWFPEYHYHLGPMTLLVEDGQFVEKDTPITSKLCSPCAGVIELIKKKTKIESVIVKPGKRISKSSSKIPKFCEFENHIEVFDQKSQYLSNFFFIQFAKVYKLDSWKQKSFTDLNFVNISKVIFINAKPNTRIFSPFKLFSIFLQLKVKQKGKSFNCIKISPTLISPSTWGLHLQAGKIFEFSNQISFQNRQKFLFHHYPFFQSSIEKISNPLRKFQISSLLSFQFNKILPDYLTRMPKSLGFQFLPKYQFDDEFSTIEIFLQTGKKKKLISPVAKINYPIVHSGEIHRISSYSLNKNRFLLLNSENFLDFGISYCFGFFQSSKSLDGLSYLSFLYPIGQFVYEGEKFSIESIQKRISSFRFPQSGQIIRFSFSFIRIRKATPYFTSEQTGIQKPTKSLIEKNEPLLTLVYTREKTGDIVQGLPKIEEYLEARKTKGLNSILNNLHVQLKTLFKLYSSVYPLDKATEKSFRSLQKIIVDQIQLVYISQGVTISDKHIEIIVRQMTSKVLIQKGQQTGLLPGELIDFQKIQKFNQKISFANKVVYKPIVLGVTKASLNTESFISAASFQETTRILTQAAIKGKTDWLQGLKENVILGRLIPAGTGLQD